MNNYGIIELIKTSYALVVTKIFYRNMRLIRRPVYIRGKSSICGANKLTTGYSCRFDLLGKKKKTLYIGEDCQMGDNVHIVAHDKVTIGNNVLIASKVFISDTSHGKYDQMDDSSSPYIKPKERKLFTSPVIIGDNVWIGDNVSVLMGVHIGKGCIVGANSVVTRDLPDNVIAVGSPARIIKKYNDVNSKWETVN